MLKVFAVGNLGRNAELKTLEGGRQLIEFSIAHTEKWTANGTTQEKTTWCKVTKWIPQGGSTALAQYLTQGTKVAVTGRVEARGFASKEMDAGGNPIIKAEMVITADDIELCGGGQQANAQTAAAPPQQAAPIPPPPTGQPVWDANSGQWVYPKPPMPQPQPQGQPGGFNAATDLPF